MANKIEVELTANTAEVEKKLKDLQTKLRSMREIGGPAGGGSSAAASDFKERATLNLRKQATDELEKQKKSMQNMMSTYNEVDRQIKNNIISEDKITQAKNQQSKRMDEIITKQKSIVELQKQLNAGLEKENKLRSFMRGAAGTAVGVGMTMQNFGNFRQFLADIPSRRAGRQLDIAQGSSQFASRAMNEQGREDIIFAPERRQAMGQMMDYYQGANTGRYSRAYGKALTTAGTTVAATDAGYEMGSDPEKGVMNKIKNFFGKGDGGSGSGGDKTILDKIRGLGTGLVAGGNTFMSQAQDEETLAGGQDILSLFSSDDAKTKLNEMTMQEAFQRFNTFEQRNRLADPGTYLQKQFINQKGSEILGLQRSGGLSDEDFYGEDGFLQRGSRDFTFSQRAGAARGIVGAGGGGAASQELNIEALKAERGMGLTNSQQAYGRLSSYMGAGESKEAFIKILATGMSMGLDDSEFVESQKDYFDQVTMLAQQVAGNEALAAAGVSAGMGDDLSRRGVQFGAEGFKNITDLLNNTGGVSGAVGASLIDEDPMMKNIKGIDRLSFQDMRFEDINENSDKLKAYFEKAGGKPGDEKGLADFAKRYRGIRREALMGGYADTDAGKDVMKAFDQVDSGAINLMPEDERKKYLAGEAANFAKFQGKTGLTEEQEMALFMSYAAQERKAQDAKRLKKTSNQKRSNLKGDSTASDLLGIGGMFGEQQLGAGVYAPMTDDESKVQGDYGKSSRYEDKLKQGEAQTQAETFTNIAQTLDGMKTALESNVKMSAKDALIFNEFLTAMKDGPEAMENFVKSVQAVNEKIEGKGVLEKMGDTIEGWFDGNESQSKVE